jgi:hypothetical protein
MYYFDLTLEVQDRFTGQEMNQGAFNRPEAVVLVGFPFLDEKVVSTQAPERNQRLFIWYRNMNGLLECFWGK